MNKLLSRLICGVGLLSAGILTAATTPPVTVSTPVVQLNWNPPSSIQSLQLPKFDPALGTLQSVKISVNFGAQGDLEFENLDNAPRHVFIDVLIYVRMYRGVDVLLSPVAVMPTLNQWLDAYDHVPDYMGPSGIAIPGVTLTAPTEYLEYTAPGDDLSPYIGPGTIPYTFRASATASFQGSDNVNVHYPATAQASATVVYTYTPPTLPGLTLEKTASSLTLDPFKKCTYTYTVRNTGGVDLFNVEVTDDNATPAYLADDFVVGTIPTLAAGQSVSLTAEVIPPVCLIAINADSPSLGKPAGSMITKILPNGDVQATYLQSFAINDNTYGTGMVGWTNGKTHTFGNLVGSDKLELRFFRNDGTVAWDGYLDTVSQISSYTFNGKTYTYPSGYGTAGPFDNEGSLVAGSLTDVVDFSTTISESLNRPLNVPFKPTLIINSPTTTGPNGTALVNLALAPGGWNATNGFSVTIKGSVFGASGFGRVTVPDQHNSPAKDGGPHQTVTTNAACLVTNTATAKTLTAGGLTATAQAVVALTGASGGGGGGGGGGNLGDWTAADIGSPKKLGISTVTPTLITIEGGGNDIGGADDQLHFLYQTGTGDCAIQAKVTSVEDTDPKAMAGVMIRETTKKNSKYASMLLTAREGIKLKSRGDGGELRKDKLKAPYWVRVVRTGNVFTGSYSKDGVTWTVLGTKTITMGSNVLIGLAVCAHDDKKLCTGTFENVTLTK